MTGYLLALDVGSTTTRAVLFDLDAHSVAEAYAEPRVYHPQPNWAEIDAEEQWRCAVTVIRRVLQEAAVVPDEIRGVGVTGLMHALIPLDDAGRPLARAMLWMDQRCQPQVEWMLREHGAVLQEALGAAHMSTTSSAPKLRWLAEHEPDILRRTAQFLLVKDYMRFKLTGAWATDPSDAGGTALYDSRRGDWSRVMLALVGVPYEKMPPIRASAQVAGAVTAEAAALTGLPAGTPVVVGGSDVHCTRLGANVHAEGQACLYLGTAAWIAAPQRALRAFGATATTGATLKWLVELLSLQRDTPAESYGRLLQEAEGAPPGAKGLLFLPHLSGERGPQPNAAAKGVFFGLTLAHGRAELVRAVLEGCALHLHTILDGFEAPLAEMAIVGGGAKSALWRGIIADVTGVTLLVPAVPEAGALGAAILAGVGVGVYPSAPEAAARLVRFVERRAPDASRQAFYARVYRVYRDLEERVAPLYDRVPVPAYEEEV